MSAKGSPLERLRSAGLVPVSCTWAKNGPSVSLTWQLVAASALVPDVIIPISAGVESVTSPWEHAIGNANVLAPQNILLTAPPLVDRDGGLEWIAVQLTDAVDLAALADDRGGLEFVSRSLDGRSYCGVTTEEDGYWIVTGEYPVARRQSWIDVAEWPPAETATVSGVISIFRSDENIPQLKIALTKVLHEIYGCPISAAREVVDHLDESLTPTISEGALENIWARIRHQDPTG
ncbi:hypothetical protein [Nocardia asteroides]|uniref:hypothetical protein n=1 Tax=Nocardia asteroides TaxID=1824 RepID=UPI001E409A5D|nr:hypothetical protein [Nocardia asteroides]UGT57634.1 hypothetical protein LTT85_12665 [Nocardia asteroides]